MTIRWPIVVLVAIVLGGMARAADEAVPAWTQSEAQPPLDEAETREFMKELARFVFENHLKTAADSPQQGMVYEYLSVPRKGEFDQFFQGEALDTMHDGAWLAAALVNAHRATGDEFYKDFLTDWTLPFYLKMLNHSDELFDPRRNDARPGAEPWGKEWGLIADEKGFVPYYWDDGGSVSLERRRDKNPLAIRPSADDLAGKPNPRFLLSGYSLGSSNHLAQDLGVMLQLAWLLLRESDDAADQRLARETADAAWNLHESRMRHFGHIPMVDAPAALARGDAGLMRHVPAADDPRQWTPSNHSTRALADFRPGERCPTPGFADEQEYRYYYGIAKTGGTVPPPLAFRIIYDAFTEPLLYRYYSDDAPVPAGINRFDLHPYFYRDGRPEDYRSDHKGPFGRPRPIGSRMGPQNMVSSGWALQLLAAQPGIWEERYRREFADDLRVFLHDPLPGQTEPIPAVAAEIGGQRLRLWSDRYALHLSGNPAEDALTITVYSRPDAKGSHAVITWKEGKVTAVNDRGEELMTLSLPTTRERMSVAIPYTTTKGQPAWANAVEQGRYSIRVGDRTRNLYLASSEAQVKTWLERELGKGLRTWRMMFHELGYIPTGLNAGTSWNDVSDTGGYAHLLSAGSQWLLYLQHRRDWQEQW